MKLEARLPLLLAAAAIAALTVAIIVEFPPRIVWNGSKSAPRGVYILRQLPLEHGRFVLVNPPPAMKKFIERRGYLPPDTPLIKRVRGLPGDEVCREGDRIFINKIHVATALKADSMGRDMPHWSGCFTLQEDEIFLLNEHEKSLDGRYFRTVKRWRVIGTAYPLWTRK